MHYSDSFSYYLNNGLSPFWPKIHKKKKSIKKPSLTVELLTCATFKVSFSLSFVLGVGCCLL